MEFTKQTIEPLYQQVKNYILQNIEDEVWESGQKILSEERLGQACKVNRLTARKAITELVNIGILVRRPKRGTYVANRSQDSRNNKPRTFKIGFFSSENYSYYGQDPYSSGLFNGVLKTLSKTPYHIIYENCTGNYLDKIYNLFDSIDGAIFTAGVNPEVISHARSIDLPFVFLDYAPEFETADCFVKGDYEAGSRQALQYLYELGHRNIAVLIPALDNYIKYDQIRGINSISNHYFGIKVSKQDVAYEIESTYNATKKLLKSASRPTAIYVLEDAFINGCMQAINEAGLNVPGDISIISGEGIKSLNGVYPFSVNKLVTTMQIDVFRIGKICMKKLFDYISQGTVPESSFITQGFLDRKTCKKHNIATDFIFSEDAGRTATQQVEVLYSHL